MSLRARGEKPIWDRKHSQEWNPKKEKKSAEETKTEAAAKKKEKGTTDFEVIVQMKKVLELLHFSPWSLPDPNQGFPLNLQ